MAATQTRELLVVGAGMGTAYLLQELARLPHDWSITVIGEEARPCYNRVLLSSLLAGELAAADLDMLPADCAARFHSGVRATALDTRARQVHCDDGVARHYDALVIATGARVALPPIDTLRAADNIHVVRTLADVDALRTLSSQRGARAVVLGGGLLGLEAAHGLNSLGFSTAVLHRNPTLMNRQLDREGGQYLQRILEGRGLGIRTGVTPAALDYSRDGRLRGLRLEDGGRIDCDLLVLATGIVPNKDLAAQPALRSERGILVDEQLRTSVQDVYALGECCQYGEHTFGLVAPVREQAAVLTRALCGVRSGGFSPSDWPVQLKISGVDIFRAGRLDPGDEHIVFRAPAQGVYRRLAIADNRLVGTLLVGDGAGSSWYAQLIREGSPIDALRQGLMFGRDVATASAAAGSAGDAHTRTSAEIIERDTA